MRKHLSVLMLLAALLLPGVLRAQDCTQTVPYTQDFESFTGTTYSASTGLEMPTCWDGYSSSTSTTNIYMPRVVSGTGSYAYYHGSKGFAMTGGTNTSYGMNKYVLLPPMNVALNQLQITFWMCTESSSATYGTLHVGYVTSDDTATFVSVANFPSSSVTAHSGNGVQASGVGLDVEVILSSVPTSATRLALKWEHGNSSYHTCCIDDLVISYPPTCPRIDSLSVIPSSDEAIVSWVETGTATQWEVTATSGTGIESSEITSLNPFTVDNLTPNTPYNVTVRAVCGVNDTSLARSIDFRTACAPIATEDLPWNYGFEDASGSSATSTFNPCLGRHTNYSTAYPYPSTTNKHSGTYALYMYSTSAYYSYLTLPVFEEDLDQLQLTFWAYRTSTATYGHWAVGVMTNPNDLSTFDTIASGQVGNAWEKVEIPLLGYTGTGSYLAILCPNMSAASYVYIDDITVEPLPDCVRPVGINVVEATENSVELSWIGEASGYTVEYGPVGFTMGQGQMEVTTTNSITIYDLSMGTNYAVYITAVCSDTNSSPSYFTFSTACAAISELPWSEDFEGQTASATPNCWTNAGGTTQVLVSAANSHSGDHYLRLSGSTTGNIILLPAIDESLSLSDLSLVFYTRPESITNANCGTFSVGYFDDNNNWIKLDSCAYNDFAAAAYEYKEIPLTSVPTGVQVGFRQDAGSTSWYWYIDDVTLLLTPQCAHPEAVIVSDITTDGATITIVDTTNVGNYVINISGDTVYSEEVTSSVVELTNLQHSSHYIVTVAAICPDGNVTTSVSTEFRTLCLPIVQLPYTQDFEDSPTGSNTSHDFVPCMNRLNNGTQYFGCPYVSSTSSYNHTEGGTKGLYWTNSTTTGTYGDYQCVVLPAVNTEDYPINTLQVRFWARATSTSYSPVFQVGVMTDPNDINTFQPVQNVNVEGTTYTEYGVVLGGYTGEGQYVAIKAVRPTVTWYATVDDITLEEMPPCPAITGITSATTVGSAVLSWEWMAGYEAPDNYVVTYDSIGATGTPNTLSASTNSALITGLNANTSYKAYVQADCGEDGMGLMDSVVFTTGDFGCVYDPEGMIDVTVGEGTTTNTYIPSYSLYNYGYSQQIYKASEIGGSGSILSITLTPSAISHQRTYEIYMGQTSDTAAASFITPDGLTCVYNGGHIQLTAGEPVTFNLTTPFNYSDTGNLVVIFRDMTGSYVSGNSWVGHTAWTNASRYVYRDASAYDVPPTVAGTASTYRNDITFFGGVCHGVSSCAAPAVLASEMTTTSVTLTWAPGYDETSWNVDYRLHGDTAWTSATVGVTTNEYTVDGLQSGTDYDFRVWFTCTSNDTYTGTVSAATLCAPKTLPYLENFEGVNVLPNCWDYVMTGTSTYQTGTYLPSIYTNTATTSYAVDSKCLKIYGVGLYMLPEVNAPLDSLRILFTDTITAATSGLIVGAMENGIFVPIDTVDLTTGTRNYIEVMLNNYHGNSRVIALKNYYTTSTSTYTSTHYIDNITVDYIPVCSHVDSLTVVNVTDASVSLGWVRTAQEESWAVGYGDALVVVNDMNATLTGLSPDSTYTFSVYSICDVGDTSEPANITVRTACAPMALPYMEDFESYESGSANPISTCWRKGSNSTTAYPYPYSTNAVTGQRSLYFYAYQPSSATSTPYYSYVALPLFQEPVNNLTLNFNVRRHSTTTDYYTTRLVIGVMSDPMDIATFEPVDTLDLKDELGSSVHNYECSFGNYMGSGQYIAIYDEVPPLYGTASYSYSYAYVDDIVVDVIPSCPRVTNLTAMPQLHSANISWVDTSSNTGWNVEYDSVQFTPGMGHMTPVHVVDTFAVLTGLDSATLYHVYVYPDCDSGAFFRHITVTTLAAPPAAVPYSCDFEAPGVNGWDFVNGDQPNYWMVGDAVNNGGSRAMYITNNDTANAYTITSQSYVFATRFVELTDTGDYVCGFDWKAQGEGSFDFIRAALVPASATLTPGAYSGFDNTTGMPMGGISLDGGGRLNLQGTAWQTQASIFHVSTPGTYKIVFLWRNDNSAGSQPPAAIDNVMLQPYTCPLVEDLAADNITATQLSLNWTDVAGAAEWQVRYSNGETTNYLTAANHPVTVTGLAAMTNYSFSVRPICTEGDTGMWCSPILVTTSLCDNVTIVNVDSANGTGYYVPVNNYYKYTLSETIIDSAELTGANDFTAIAYSYAHTSPTTSKTNVTIWIQPTNKSEFSSNSDMVALDSSIAVQVYSGELNCSQGWNYFAFDNVYTWDGHSNLLIIVDDNSNAYNTSSHVFYKSPCTGYKSIYYYSDSQNPDPAEPDAFTATTKAYAQYRATMQLLSCGNAHCEEPTLSIDSVGEAMIEISWVGSADSYEVAIVEGDWVEPSAGEPEEGTSYTFNGLDDMTMYTVAVRGVCGSIYSNWVMLSATTLRHPCIVPTDITITDNTFDGATVSWTAGENETEWEVNVFCASPAYNQTFQVSDNPTLAVTGLSNGVTYSVTVRAMCDSAWYSPWSDTVALTTTTCAQVTGVSASNLTATSATITWTSTGAGSYEIEYGIGGFQAGTGATVTSTTNSVNISGLEEQTPYDVYVRGVCGEGVFSLWSGKYTFTTTESTQGIDDVESGNVTLFPNPASTMVTIRGIEGMSQVTVVDLNGREMFKANAENSLTIDVSGYAKGAYFVRITGERTTAIRKLVVK